MKNNEYNSCPACPKKAQELLDMYFLDIRSALLESASALDRLDRAEGAEELHNDPRIGKLIQACEILKSKGINRTEEFLKLFSE